MPLIDIILIWSQEAAVFHILDTRSIDIGIKGSSCKFLRIRLGHRTAASLGHFRSLSELFEAAINRSCAFDRNDISGFNTMVLLESENDSRVILHQEALGVSPDNSSFNLIYFIDWWVQHLSNGRCLDCLFFAEFDKFSPITFDKEHIVNSIDTAHLRYKLDIQAIAPVRKGKVNSREPPLSWNILNFSEAIVQSLGPKFSVSRHAYLKVGLDKCIGCALGIALSSETEPEILGGNGYIADCQIWRGSAEEDIVLSRTVILRQFALRRLVCAAGHTLEFVSHIRCSTSLLVFPAIELVKKRPLSSISKCLGCQVCIEVAVVDCSSWNIFLRNTIVLHLNRDCVHIGLIGSEQPAGDGDIVFWILCPEVLGHIVQTSHHRTSLYFKVCIIAWKKDSSTICHIFDWRIWHIGLNGLHAHRLRFGKSKGGCTYLFQCTSAAELDQTVSACSGTWNLQEVTDLEIMFRTFKSIDVWAHLLKENAIGICSYN